MTTTVQEPEWTAENRNRRQGDTTFNICGWCKFAGCGTCRYDCHIESRCDLLPSWKNEVTWDTPCKVVALGKLDLQDIIRSKKGEIESFKHQITSTETEIEELTKLCDKAEKKPALPDSRDCDYFPLKARVWVFLDKKNDEKGRFPRTGWFVGTVVDGYRSGDGCVSYVLDEIPVSREGWGCGMSVPVVLLDWEYQFFKDNPEDFGRWLKASDRTYNGNRMNIAAMAKI
jgi:hypothetical protein